MRRLCIVVMRRPFLKLPLLESMAHAVHAYFEGEVHVGNRRSSSAPAPKVFPKKPDPSRISEDSLVTVIKEMSVGSKEVVYLNTEIACSIDNLPLPPPLGLDHPLLASRAPVTPVEKYESVPDSKIGLPMVLVSMCVSVGTQAAAWKSAPGPVDLFIVAEKDPSDPQWPGRTTVHSTLYELFPPDSE